MERSSSVITVVSSSSSSKCCSRLSISCASCINQKTSQCNIQRDEDSEGALTQTTNIDRVLFSDLEYLVNRSGTQASSDSSPVPHDESGTKPELVAIQVAVVFAAMQPTLSVLGVQTRITPKVMLAKTY